MKLLTKAIEKKLEKFPLCSQDGKGDDADIICKFFNPMGSGTWYVLEGEPYEKDDGTMDWQFYGYVVSEFPEYGYFTLSDLESVKRGGLGVERDRYFDKCKLSEVVEHVVC